MRVSVIDVVFWAFFVLLPFLAVVALCIYPKLWWKKEIGLPKHPEPIEMKNRATVVLIDDGVGTHFARSNASIMSTYNVSVGEDGEAVVDDEEEYVSGGSHGSMMARTILETSRGIYLVSYKCCDGKKLNEKALNAAINYVVDAKTNEGSPEVLKNVRVINLSYGKKRNDPDGAEAIKRAYENGILVVASAGNDFTDVDYYPASLRETLCVSAMHRWPVRGVRPAPFSNRGNHVDLCAPGSQIGGDRRYGTSYSTAIVSAVAGHLFSLDMDATPSQIATLMLGTARDDGAPGLDDRFGYGTVDFKKAMEAMSNSDWKNAAPLWPR